MVPSPRRAPLFALCLLNSCLLLPASAQSSELGLQFGQLWSFTGRGQVLEIEPDGVEMHRLRWNMTLAVVSPRAAQGWQIAAVAEEREELAPGREPRLPAMSFIAGEVTPHGAWPSLEIVDLSLAAFPIAAPVLALPNLPPDPRMRGQCPVQGVWVFHKGADAEYHWERLRDARLAGVDCAHHRATLRGAPVVFDFGVQVDSCTIDVWWDAQEGIPLRTQTTVTLAWPHERRQIQAQLTFEPSEIAFISSGEARLLEEQFALIRRVFEALAEGELESAASLAEELETRFPNSRVVGLARDAVANSQ